MKLKIQNKYTIYFEIRVYHFINNLMKLLIKQILNGQLIVLLNFRERNKFVNHKEH